MRVWCDGCDFQYGKMEYDMTEHCGSIGQHGFHKM